MNLNHQFSAYLIYQ